MGIWRGLCGGGLWRGCKRLAGLAHWAPMELEQQVGRVRVGGTKDLYDPGQCRVCAFSHVQGVYGQPYRVDANHRSSSLIQAAHSLACAKGQATFTTVAPRRSSMRMSCAGWACSSSG